MALRIQPLEDAHLDEAARLLGADHARRRGLDPRLPAEFEAAEQARVPLEAAANSAGAGGFVALRDGEMVAYLLGMQRLPERALGLPPHGYAIAAGESLETYRELYAVIADAWVRRGHFEHRVTVLDADRDLRECWDSLAFGRSLTAASRDVDEPVGDPPELDIRQLGAEHIDVISELEKANARHHNTSPVFIPYLEEDRESYRSRTLTLLEDPQNAHFVAYEGGQPAGMNTFMAESPLLPLIRPDRSTYLYQGIVYETYRHAGIGRGLLAHNMRWARSQGYDSCTLHYFSSNILGARFWTSNGFRPLVHTLSRHIDERIAWARP